MFQHIGKLNDNKYNFILSDLFESNGWHLIKNDKNWVIFTKAEHETEFFEIKEDKNIIYVSIPLKNSVYQYKKKFANYSQAYEYVEERFKEFIIPTNISIQN
jgi:hypothetical protein